MTDVKIKCDDCKFVEDCVDYGWQECKKFTPTQKKRHTQETTELKPCPFCGSAWLYITTEHGWLDDSTVIFCNSCKVSVKLEENDQEGMTEETKRKAVEAWNKRVVAE